MIALHRSVAAAFALALMAAYSGAARAVAAPAPEPAAFGQERWEVPPGEFSEIQRRGFYDGAEGARKDYGNHRRPSVFNRDEYRKPHVPPEFWRDYRQAFRRGYAMAANRLWGGM